MKPLTWPGIVGLLLIAVVSVPPLVLEPRPVVPLKAAQAFLNPTIAKFLIVIAIVAIFAVRGWLDQHEGIATWRTIAGLAGVGLAFTAWHWYSVDDLIHNRRWQSQVYFGIFNGTAEAPHQFRPLPYGFARSLERLCGDWLFACLAYRWLFTTWFLWATYRLARIVHGPKASLAVALLLTPFYPLSVQYYAGQLTDPMSHALFILAFIYVCTDQWLVLGLALALGVMAKETVVLMVPAYLACYWRGGIRALGQTAFLGVMCTLAFLAVRLPLGWRFSNESINGTVGLMITSNLGIGQPLYISTTPIWQNYVHPVVFVGLFVPIFAIRWKTLDPRFRTLIVVVVPLLLASSLCFGWLYESRNYMPVLPLLLTMAIRPAGTSEVS
jgi:hypothetical protein